MGQPTAYSAQQDSTRQFQVAYPFAIISYSALDVTRAVQRDHYKVEAHVLLQQYYQIALVQLHITLIWDSMMLISFSILASHTGLAKCTKLLFGAVLLG